jgi:hypothetical protein
MVLPACARLLRGRVVGTPQRADHQGQRRQAAMDRVLLPDGRGGRPRLLPTSERGHFESVREDPCRQPEGEGLELANHATESRSLRPREHPARRPQDDRTPKLASSPDEYRGPVEGLEKRGLPRLTKPPGGGSTSRLAIERQDRQRSRLHYRLLASFSHTPTLVRDNSRKLASFRCELPSSRPANIRMGTGDSARFSIYS